MGYNINVIQKCTPLRESASFEPLSVKIWRAVSSVSHLKSIFFGYISRTFPEAVMDRFLSNFSQQ